MLLDFWLLSLLFHNKWLVARDISPRNELGLSSLLINTIIGSLGRGRWETLLRLGCSRSSRLHCSGWTALSSVLLSSELE